jgi:adenine-specific DNA glycosylase
VDGAAEHVFTHFALKITALHGRVATRIAAKIDGQWQQPRDAALPTVMKKMLGLLPEGGSVRSRKNPRRGQARS